MRFVQPETIDLTLPSGEWIRVKKELTVGEDRQYRARGLRRMSGVGDRTEIDVDWSAMALARVEAYLIDWSAKDAKDQPVPVTRATLESLATEDFEAIDAAIQQHLERMDQEKKARSGSGNSTPPSS